MSNEEKTTGLLGVVLPIWTETMLVELCHIQSGPEVQIAFLKRLRDARLSEVDTIERMLDMHPRTAEIRSQWRENRK